MNILLLGSGGREHTFAWKIKQSPLCDQLFIAPGNAGTSTLGDNLDLSAEDFPALKNTVLKKNIKMIVVGPEAPLVAGIYDFFASDPELSPIPVVGPSREGARLEGSKDFAKAFMKEFNIPTASYQTFSTEQLEEGLEFISRQKPPVVLKADGLAAGKGVLICESIEQAKSEFRNMLGGKFGDAGKKIVIEQFLDGIEFSVFVLTNGKNYFTLPVAKDYKRIGEGDTGLNTGGMGSVSPVPFVDDVLMQKVEQKIIQPTIQGIQERGLTYHGFIFFGLIKVDGEPFVIEYNCRMGDPETQVVLPRMQNDLVELMQAMEAGRLHEFKLKEDPRTATSIVLVSGGYPESYEKGKEIRLPVEVPSDSLLFHAGTREQQGLLLTNGGRVLNLTSFGNSIPEAREKSLELAEGIHFEGKYFRRDIGQDLVSG
jgi:phosphoribosylamine--glycine ligase